ncbi:MAG: helix-turn-helix transcriptional regulator [Chloroflexi bacterium]|nr:helix-turn-helix transcriptional regulator [Chloroflexota bacterium]
MTKKQITKIAQSIRQARLSAGITQQYAADRAGISQSFWSEIERGVWMLSVQTLLKVAKALGVKPEELLPE